MQPRLYRVLAVQYSVLMEKAWTPNAERHTMGNTLEYPMREVPGALRLLIHHRVTHTVIHAWEPGIRQICSKQRLRLPHALSIYHIEACMLDTLRIATLYQYIIYRNVFLILIESPQAMPRRDTMASNAKL